MAQIDGLTALTIPEIDENVLQQIASGSYYDPHSILGQHLIDPSSAGDPITVIRTLRPLATEVVAVLSNGARTQLTHLYGGIWQGFTITGLDDYLIDASYGDGSTWTADDPYRFSPTLGELDTSSAKAGTSSSGTFWERTTAHTTASTRQQPAPRSRSGRHMPAPCA